MRVLWFAHAPDPRLAGRLGIRPARSGYWTYSLADAMVAMGSMTHLTIASHARVREVTTVARDGVTHVVMPERSARDTRSLPSAELTAQCQALIDRLAPDIVHIHGVEKNYGLVVRDTKVPMVSSIHGLIHRMGKNWFSSMSVRETLTSQTWEEARRRSGSLVGGVLVAQRGKLERRVVEANTAFIGVSSWDRAHVRLINPTARYWQIFPALRPQFLSGRWDQASVQDNTRVFTAVAAVPWKGLHILLRAVALLRGRGRPVRLRLAGDFSVQTSGYRRFLDAEIDRLNVRDAIEAIGFLGPARLVEELESAAVAIIPSFVENYSLTLMEAMAVGTPTIVSFTGGLGTVARDGVDGLFFIPGDEALLAEQIERLLTDAALARSLSISARTVAAERHDPASLAQQTRDAYGEVVGKGPGIPV
ncbi:MAG: glycosyltransferase family 4 protein [Gammaproteobacteria bacterium]